jgi:multidrug transporter EmrE-like cation transporter
VLPARQGKGIFSQDMDAINQLGQLNQNFLLANCFWSAVASGYMIYGWRQRSLIPFLGGFVMLGVSCFTPALTMSAVNLAILFAVWWLMKQGY